MKNPLVTLLQSRIGYRIESFIVGWYKTLEIKFRHPELWRDLSERREGCLFCADDRPYRTWDEYKAQHEIVSPYAVEVMSAEAADELLRETEDGEAL